MRELNFYLSFAEKLIKSYAKIKKIKVNISDEFISYVAHRIIKGDHNFILDKVSKSKQQLLSEEECKRLYLKQCGIYGIRAYLSRNKNNEEKRIPFTDMFDYNKGVNEDSYLNISNSKYNPLEILCREDDVKEAKKLLKTLISSSGLTKHETYVVAEYLNGDKTFSDIAEENNVSPQAIHIAYQKALQKMSSMVKRV